MESVKILQEVDIVVSNPPFSKFSSYIKQLDKRGKEFLILGNHNAVALKTIFPMYQNESVWFGRSSNVNMEFGLPRDAKKWKRVDEEGNKIGSVGSISWYTNIGEVYNPEKLELTEKYKKRNYKKYDNKDAINVGFVKDIPKNYGGLMGVPVSFLSKHNREQFEVEGAKVGDNGKNLSIGGEIPYVRILVRNKEVQDEL